MERIFETKVINPILITFLLRLLMQNHCYYVYLHNTTKELYYFRNHKPLYISKNLVSSSFSWSDSPQGFDYWMAINEIYITCIYNKCFLNKNKRPNKKQLYKNLTYE